VTPRILIVEDDEAIATGLSLNLKLAGRGTSIPRDGDEAIRQAQTEDFALVLLDINLPKKNGLEVLRELKAADNIVPVIVLSARDGEFDKVAALRLGADDYVTKPFAIGELLARLRAVLRRAGSPEQPLVEIGPIRVDLEKSSVTVGGELVHLTPHEFKILRLLALNEGKLLTHRAILREVWGPAYGGESNYLHVYVSQLRRKLEPDPARPRYLLTEPGAGYRLVAPAA